MYNEEWRWIPGYELKYQASSLGKIKSFIRYSAGKIIGGVSLSTKGYPRVNIEGKIINTHRLIAGTFISNPENKEQVNHINGLKTDNRACNLEWVTNMENRQHAVKNNLIVWGEEVGGSKLTSQQVLDIKTLYGEGIKQKQIAGLFNICQQTVSRIVTDKAWLRLKNS